MGSATPIIPGTVAQRPQMFGTSYMRTHSMRNNNQILHGDQTRCEENFYRVTMPAALGNIFGDTIGNTRALFAVANLLVMYYYVLRHYVLLCIFILVLLYGTNELR